MLRSSISTAFTIGVVMMSITAGRAMAGIPVDTPIAAHGIVAQEAINVLPAPLRPYFESRLEKIQFSAGSFDKNHPAWHYVLLDTTANIAAWEDRLQAARQFPRNQQLAEILFNNNNLPDQGGQLPWVILKQFDELTRAFQTGDEIKITAEAALLLHFVTDACWPMNTTVERFESTQQIQSATISRKYLEASVVFDSLREQLSYEMRVSPSRYKIITEPAEAIFDELLNSFSTLNEIDKVVKNNRIDGRMAQIFEQRMESAAVLAAGLIGTAWKNANSPTFSDDLVQSAQPDSNMIRNHSTGTPDVSFVGSKNSGVLHLSTCTHVKRIKPGNMVRFTSLDEALKAGRKDCKTCNPGSKTP